MEVAGGGDVCEGDKALGECAGVGGEAAEEGCGLYEAAGREGGSDGECGSGWAEGGVASQCAHRGLLWRAQDNASVPRGGLGFCGF